MLDAFIIEQLRRREKTVDDRPTLQLPVPPEREPQREDSRPNVPDEDDGQRGVVIIDFGS